MAAHRQALKRLAQSGYVARGVVYLIIGGFACLAAFGSGGGTSDSKDALAALLGAPFGKVLLILVAVGLVGYAVWRAVQAIFDVDGHGTDVKGLAVRGGLGVSAVTHTLLALFAFGLIFAGIGSGGDGGGKQGMAATLMSQPFGQWLAALVGLAIVGAGLAQIVKGWKAGFTKYLALDGDKDRWVMPISRFGLIARGVVFALVGAFFVLAAWQADPSEARGLSGALDAVRSAPFGWALFALIALGLFAFGLYSLVEARYRRIPQP
jgi:MFS family permease